MSEWQDISTAPKDGTPVLLYATVTGWEDSGYSRCVGWFDGWSWSAYGPAFGEPVARKDRRRGRKEPQRITSCSPSHWMPLPQPPEAAE